MKKKITIVGLGAGDLEQLPLGVYRMLQGEQPIYLRTKEHPVVQDLEQEGMKYRSFDEIYEKHDEFSAVYDEICEVLLEKAETESLIYAVPGHPLVAERTVQLLLERGPVRGIELELAGGQSFLDPIFQALKIDPIEGFQLLDGTALHKDEIRIEQHLLIGQVYDAFVASNVKLTLMEKLPYDYEVTIVTAAGTSAEQLRKVPLYELDREVELNNLTSLYVPPVKDAELLYKEFSKLRDIIGQLRGPNGCPWDLKQTHQSLKTYLIEEAYELIEAINNDDIDHMIEELGDVLLQVMLHAQIGEDEGFFAIEDVIKTLAEKMVRRHPHVFGEVHADTEEEVLKNWQQIKEEEKGKQDPSILAGINSALPNLLKAVDLQKRAAKVGFDWDDALSAFEKVKEELAEFEVEIRETNQNETAIMDEFGDVLFALVNVARFYRINPEEALFMTNQKFINRFTFVEKKVAESGRSFADHNLEQLDQYWNEAKQKGL